MTTITDGILFLWPCAECAMGRRGRGAQYYAYCAMDTKYWNGSCNETMELDIGKAAIKSVFAITVDTWMGLEAGFLLVESVTLQIIGTA